MTRSKLAIYADARFGPADEADGTTEADPGPAPPPRRAPPSRRRARRGGLGVLGTIRLLLMLGPVAILAGGPLLLDCGRRQGSWMPGILQSAACARRDLTDRVYTLEAQLRAVASGFR